MESLLAQQSATVEKLADKKVAWVKVITVTKDAVLVDVGEKNEGSIPLVEFVEDLVAPKAPLPRRASACPSSRRAAATRPATSCFRTSRRRPSSAGRWRSRPTPRSSACAAS
ncbi:MAG: hypothetical protein M0D55_13730 [Elusimicrobiota bacterium]|nr:MAG: hypothetical protein M0D55_13730 [Elusimicrobiota bacterium]